MAGLMPSGVGSRGGKGSQGEETATPPRILTSWLLKALFVSCKLHSGLLLGGRQWGFCPACSSYQTVKCFHSPPSLPPPHKPGRIRATELGGFQYLQRSSGEPRPTLPSCPGPCNGPEPMEGTDVASRIPGESVGGWRKGVDWPEGGEQGYKTLPSPTAADGGGPWADVRERPKLADTPCVPLELGAERPPAWPAAALQDARLALQL